MGALRRYIERRRVLRLLAELWRAGESAWTPGARRIFGELEVGDAAGKRQLLESSTFRGLLEHGTPMTAPALPQAA